MYIRKVHLTNFKRFHEVVIDLSTLAPPPKLVLLIGANGSGKSSVFDAFGFITLAQKDAWQSYAPEYYPKSGEGSFSLKIEFSNGQLYEVHDGSFKNQGQPSNPFYGRTALRQVPRLTRTHTNQPIDIVKDSDAPKLSIERDERFENDISSVAERILREVFNGIEFDAKLLRERYIAPINRAMQQIFGVNGTVAPELVTLIPPLGGKVADIRFRKGRSEFRYDLLSSGEKEVFNLLLNLFNRRDVYQDTIYFIDELDVHLNTALQYALLKEISENWIPDNCQLWTASHSLGFIQYAKEAEHATIIDFDLFDFDQPRTLLPERKDSLEVYEVVVPKEMIFRLFDGKQIVLCENKNDEFYNLLSLGQRLFVGVKDKNEVYRNAKSNPQYAGLIDRDYLSDEEIKRLRQRYPNLYVLGMYAFENYLYHPDNILEVAPNFDSNAYRAEIVRQKQAQFHEILIRLRQARSYKLLTDENLDDAKQRDRAETAISKALASDDFDTFYPFFNMKSRFHAASLAQLNLTTKSLVQTKWFRRAISQIFGGE